LFIRNIQSKKNFQPLHIFGIFLSFKLR
jgi:hypothetical protein